MRITATKEFYGPVSDRFQLPTEDHRGRSLSHEDFSSYVSSLVRYMKNNPSITFYITSTDFDAARQETLKPIYSQQNIIID